MLGGQSRCEQSTLHIFESKRWIDYRAKAAATFDAPRSLVLQCRCPLSVSSGRTQLLAFPGALRLAGIRSCWSAPTVHGFPFPFAGVLVNASRKTRFKPCSLWLASTLRNEQVRRMCLQYVLGDMSWGQPLVVFSHTGRFCISRCTAGRLDVFAFLQSVWKARRLGSGGPTTSRLCDRPGHRTKSVASVSSIVLETRADVGPC